MVSLRYPPKQYPHGCEVAVLAFGLGPVLEVTQLRSGPGPKSSGAHNLCQEDLWEQVDAHVPRDEGSTGSAPNRFLSGADRINHWRPFKSSKLESI